MYSEEVQKMIDEAAESEGQRNYPKLRVPKVRLHGKEGRFYILERDASGRFVKEEALFGPDNHDRFECVILRAAYFAQWKYRENAPFKLQTREFASFESYPVELLKITFGEGGSTETVRTYPDYQTFKSVHVKTDEVSGQLLPAPYDLFGVLYVWSFNRQDIVAFVFKSSTLSNWFRYTREYQKGLKDVKTLLQVRTMISASPERNDKAGMDYFAGKFEAFGLCTNEDLQGVAGAFQTVKEYQEACKALYAKNMAPLVAKPEHMPLQDALQAAAATEEQDIRLEDIPF